MKHDTLAERLRLIVLTDRRVSPGREITDVVREALRGGATAIQLRAKDATGREIWEMARQLRPLAREAGALFFVNDRVDVAIAADADGAHIGDDDLPLEAARALAPPGFILGRSAATAEEARRAEAAGADYLGVGPVFPTPSKADAGDPILVDRITVVASAVRIPIVGIGGIKIDSARAVAEAGAAGIAVIRTVMQAKEPEDAARRLLAEVDAAGRSTTR